MTIVTQTTRSGVGLRLPHLEEAVATRPSVGWFEVHPENFLANPHATELLENLASHYRVSVHTVGLSVGSAGGLDLYHLRRVKELVDRLDPCFVSGHLAWSTHPGEYLNDLLPLPYTPDTLAVVVEHIQQLQDALGRVFLLENPSVYLGFAGSSMTEPQFLSEVVDRTGCRLLCDVSNVYLSAHNMDYDASGYLRALPAAAIAQMHLGGFTPEPDEARPGQELLVDTHAERVHPSAWALYTEAIGLFGPQPTLIEWDNDLPSLDDLVDEARNADALVRQLADPTGVPCAL
jgi:uncharacterized protein